MSAHMRAAEIIRRMKVEMPVHVTLTDPFTGQPYTISKENLLNLLVLDTSRLTFEGQVIAALHAELSRASRACELEALRAEAAYRKWQAQIGQKLRSDAAKHVTEKMVEEAYRTDASYEEMSGAPQRWRVLMNLFGDLRESTQIKASIIRAHEKSLDDAQRAAPSETIDRAEEWVREAVASAAPGWWEKAPPLGAAAPPPEVAEQATKRARKPRKESE